MDEARRVEIQSDGHKGGSGLVNGLVERVKEFPAYALSRA